jgi:hypothetical protein
MLVLVLMLALALALVLVLVLVLEFRVWWFVICVFLCSCSCSCICACFVHLLACLRVSAYVRMCASYARACAHACGGNHDARARVVFPGVGEERSH